MDRRFYVRRRTAMQLVFEWSVTGGSKESFAEVFANKESVDDDIEYIPFQDDDIDYINSVVEGVKENKQQIDELIAGRAIGWSIARMAKVDLAILRVAVFEILFRDEIPASVSANEAVEMAKTFGGDKSASFINGILGKLLRDGSIPKK